MILFSGTAALSGGTLFQGFVRGDVGPVLGAACYLCAVACTIGGNVPLNSALARISEDDDAAWRAFTPRVHDSTSCGCSWPRRAGSS
jgi:hypothetical protein